jgi:uncharacterized protein YbjT (DUF2867 family)
VARVLIVGCGCRGRALARELIAARHTVRGTTRDAARLPEIAAAGAEGVVADPDRLGTMTTQLAGVSAICWLLGSVGPDSAPDLHGPRLRTFVERLVDTPVRGVVYEAAGTVDPSLLAAGAGAVRDAATTWRMPAEIVTADPAEHNTWVAAMAAAVGRLL